MLEVCHDFHLLEVPLRVQLVRELFLLEGNRFDCVHITVPTAQYLPHYAECPSPEQLYHLEVFASQIRAVLNCAGTSLPERVTPCDGVGIDIDVPGRHTLRALALLGGQTDSRRTLRHHSSNFYSVAI